MLLAPPVDAVALDLATRRQFLAIVGAAGLLSGCVATSAPPTAETRTVTGMYGPVDLPVEPRRVVATYDDTLAHALALGLPVVAAPRARGSTGPFPWFLPRTSSPASSGSPPSRNSTSRPSPPPARGTARLPPQPPHLT